MTDATRQNAPSDSLLDGAVQDINNTLESIATQLETLSPAELIQFREGPFAAIKRMFGQVDAELVRVFSDHGEHVIHDGKVWFPTVTKSSERWDSERIVSLMAARASDWTHEDGEPLPPFIVAARIVNATAKACGALAASHGFRVTALEAEFGITRSEVANFRESERGNPTIGRRDLKASDVQDAA